MQAFNPTYTIHEIDVGAASCRENRWIGSIVNREMIKRLGIRQITTVLLFVTVFFCLSACTRDKNPSTIKKDPGIRKTVSNGSIQVQLATDKSEITTAEHLMLSLAVLSQENDVIQWPAIEDNLGKFHVAGYHTDSPVLMEDNRVKTVRIYELEPFLAGEYEIPSLKFSFQPSDKENKTGDNQQDLETEAIPIPVLSVLPDNQKDPALHGIKPPVEIPEWLSPAAWIAVVVGLLLVAGVSVFLFLRRKKAKTIEATIVLPAHEIALRELAGLARPQQMEKQEIKIFYQKISDILRRYIERRFGVNAPEQTTEEFLTGMDDRNVIAAVHKPLLRNFLSQCDLVKFAEHRPVEEDIEASFETCKHFIEQTKEESSS